MSPRQVPSPLRRYVVPVLVAICLSMFVTGRPDPVVPGLGAVAATALEGESSRPLSPIAGEVELVFAERDMELERLSRRHETAPDLEARLALEREMADVKRRAILEMFRIQRRYALERDDAATVEVMDAAIRRIEHRMAKGSTLPAEDVPVREAAPAEGVKP